MSGQPKTKSAGRVPRATRTTRLQDPVRVRVGAFVRRRREELGLSQGDLIDALHYRSRNSISNIEKGIEGLPPKRAYAWASLLQVPRDDFFRFVTGQTERMTGTPTPASNQLTSSEADLLQTYRRLPPEYQKRLQEQAHEFETLAKHRAKRR